MSKTVVWLGFALLLNAMTNDPVPADWVSGPELRESCEALLSSDDARSGSMCRAFVHGYLLGADEPNGKSGKGVPPATTGKDKESFSDRAMRTRVNPTMLERMHGGRSLDYCLEESTELTDVARVLAAQLGTDPETAEIPDADQVRQALARKFPCDA